MDRLRELLGDQLFQVGDMQVTVGTLVALVGVAAAAILLGRLASKAVQLYFEKRHGLDSLTARSYGIVAQVFVWFICLEIALNILHVRLTSILAAGGFFAVGAGFAVKNIVENVLSGNIIRLEQTINVGDLIIVQDQWLIVKRLGMRCLTATTYDGVEILIPNTLIAQSKIANLTRGDRLHRICMNVGVSYESDLDEVRATLEQAVAGLDWRSTSRDSEVFLKEFGNSSVNYSVYVWIDDAGESLAKTSLLNEAVWRALRQKNIILAYPQLDMHVDQQVVDAISGKP